MAAVADGGSLDESACTARRTAPATCDLAGGTGFAGQPCALIRNCDPTVHTDCAVARITLMAGPRRMAHRPPGSACHRETMRQLECLHIAKRTHDPSDPTQMRLKGIEIGEPTRLEAHFEFQAQRVVIEIDLIAYLDDIDEIRQRRIVSPRHHRRIDHMPADGAPMRALAMAGSSTQT